jgi:aminoglycoside phosphotransferase (APT) family kinase protein
VELELVLKDLSPSSALHSGRGVRPDFVVDAMREIETYRLILAGRQGTAKCYAAVTDHSTQQYWLLLERVPGIELYQSADLHAWQAVARWLSQLHIWGSGLAGSVADDAHLLRHTRSFYARWMQRALGHSSGRQRMALRWLAERHERVIERLVALPWTFIHGEFYASNVLVEMDGSDVLRVCAVDWEMAALGPGLMDLAALTVGSWTSVQRAQIVDAYRRALGDGSPDGIGGSEFDAALDHCRYQIAIQWLGWSNGWRPPAQHATDWLGEALSAADRLRL